MSCFIMKCIYCVKNWLLTMRENAVNVTLVGKKLSVSTIIAATSVRSNERLSVFVTYAYHSCTKVVVTHKIKHLQKCFRAVDFPRLS